MKFYVKINDYKNPANPHSANIKYIRINSNGRFDYGIDEKEFYDDLESDKVETHKMYKIKDYIRNNISANMSIVLEAINDILLKNSIRIGFDNERTGYVKYEDRGGFGLFVEDGKLKIDSVIFIELTIAYKNIVDKNIDHINVNLMSLVLDPEDHDFVGLRYYSFLRIHCDGYCETNSNLSDKIREEYFDKMRTKHFIYNRVVYDSEPIAMKEVDIFQQYDTDKANFEDGIMDSDYIREIITRAIKWHFGVELGEYDKKTSKFNIVNVDTEYKVITINLFLLGELHI